MRERGEPPMCQQHYDITSVGWSSHLSIIVKFYSRNMVQWCFNLCVRYRHLDFQHIYEKILMEKLGVMSYAKMRTPWFAMVFITQKNHMLHILDISQQHKLIYMVLLLILYPRQKPHKAYLIHQVQARTGWVEQSRVHLRANANLNRM